MNDWSHITEYAATINDYDSYAYARDVDVLTASCRHVT